MEADENPTKIHEGRVALVTGADQGIGQAIALALSERGVKVITTDLKPPHETAAKIGPAAYALQLDVTQEEQWRAVAAKIRDVGEMDIVVNNASYFPNHSIATNWICRPAQNVCYELTGIAVTVLQSLRAKDHKLAGSPRGNAHGFDIGFGLGL